MTRRNQQSDDNNENEEASGGINKEHVTVEAVKVEAPHDGAQGGMLKVKYLDCIYNNVMKIDSNTNGNDYIICSTIEDFLASEQHRLNLVSQTTLEDMKVEKRYYGQVISINRMNIINI
jgi:hypothetical protein